MASYTPLTRSHARLILDDIFGWTVDEIGETTQLRSAGIDSLRLVWLISHFSETFGIELDPWEFLFVTKVGELCGALAVSVTAPEP